MAGWRLIVYMPAYNVADSVPELLARMRACAADTGLSALIVVEDGSTDNTPALLDAEAGRTPFLRVVHKKSNEGVVAAILDGMAAALRAAQPAPETAIIVRMDADLEHQPEDLARVIAPVLSGEASLSIGYVQPDNRNGILFRIFSEHAGLDENRRFAGLAVPQFCPGFYAVRADALHSLFPSLREKLAGFRAQTGTDMVTLDVALFALAKGAGLKLSAVRLRPIEDRWIKKQPLGKTLRYLRLHLATMRFLQADG